MSEGTGERSIRSLAGMNPDLLDKIVSYLPLRQFGNIGASSVLLRQSVKRAMARISLIELRDICHDPRPDVYSLTSAISTLRLSLAVLPALTTLKIPGCALQDEMIYELGSMPNLQHLDVSSCELLTDDGLKAISQYCPKLKTIDLTFCNATTYDGVRLKIARRSRSSEDSRSGWTADSIVRWVKFIHTIAMDLSSSAGKKSLWGGFAFSNRITTASFWKTSSSTPIWSRGSHPATDPESCSSKSLRRKTRYR